MRGPIACRALVMGLAALVGGCSGMEEERNVAAKSEGAEESRPGASSPGLHFLAFEDGAGTHRYALYVPPAEIAKPPYALVVFLHGYGECGKDGVKQTAVGLLPAVLNAPERWPCVVLMPQKQEFDPLWPTQTDVVMAEVERVKKMVAVDEARVSLTGLSQGGNGTWMLAAEHPEVWCAIAPVCGFSRQIPPAEIAKRIGNVPVWAFHGLKDNVVPPAQTRDIVEAVKQVRGTGGAEVKLTEFPEANHNSWDPAYRDAKFAEWLMGQVKGR